MIILKTIPLDKGGKTVSVVQHHGGHRIHIQGGGSDAVLTVEEAAALFGALSDLDKEGLLL